MKTFRYVYGITLDATTETRRQNTAAKTVVHHGRLASGVDEFGEKKGLTCYQSDAKCIRAGVYQRSGEIV